MPLSGSGRRGRSRSPGIRPAELQPRTAEARPRHPCFIIELPKALERDLECLPIEGARGGSGQSTRRLSASMSTGIPANVTCPPTNVPDPPTPASPGRNREADHDRDNKDGRGRGDWNENLHRGRPPRRPRIAAGASKEARQRPRRGHGPGCRLSRLRAGLDDARGVSFGLRWAASRATGRASASSAARNARIA